MSYDRYKKFRQNGVVDIPVAILLPQKNSDRSIVYKKGMSRLDNISYDFYSDPSYDWLIMLANPEYGSMEYEIPDGAVLRIPYPLIDSITSYENEIDRYYRLYF